MKLPCQSCRGWLFVCLLVELITPNFIKAATETNGCDSTVWDDNVPERGVYMVSGTCSEGHIDWRHPSGAVRVSLQLQQPPLPPSSSSSSSTPAAKSSNIVEICIIAKSHHAIAKISLERDRNIQIKNTKPWQPQHPKDTGQYSYSNDNLETLVVLNQSVPFMEREVCFHSAGGAPVVLYLEAQSDMSTVISGHVEIDYDMRRPTRQSGGVTSQPDLAACRPCSDEEILEAACSADFVVRASVDAVLHNGLTLESHLRVLVHTIHKQRHQVFKRSTSAEVSSSSPAARSTHETLRDVQNNGGSIVTPLKCGVKKSSGQFMFMGQIKLKKPFLECAPRVEYFEELWKTAVQIGVNPCVLD